MLKAYKFDEVTRETTPIYETFHERKAARKQADAGKVVGFKVIYQGDVIATFQSKGDAVAFTKSSEVNTERFGWQVKPSAAAQKIGSASSEPKCEIVALREGGQ